MQKVAAFIFQGITILDVMGPIQVFLSTKVNNSPVFSVFTIGFKNEIICCGENNNLSPKIVVDYSFDDCPDYDILLIPGGYGTRQLVDDESAINILKIAAQKAKIIITVCTGSALLAKTGLLDYITATSNKISFDWVTKQCLKVNWLKEPKYVNNIKDGKGVTTSAGISSGIDCALDLVKTLYGEEVAKSTSKYLEYDWKD